jgi:hypothetical protein
MGMRLIVIGGLVAVLVAVAAAVTLIDAEMADSEAPKQRVAIVTQGTQSDPGSGVFEPQAPLPHRLGRRRKRVPRPFCERSSLPSRSYRESFRDVTVQEVAIKASERPPGCRTAR